MGSWSTPSLLWRLAERQVFAEVGLELTDADCERTMGMRTDEVIEHWYRLSPWEGATRTEVEARLEGRMRELLSRAGHGDAWRRGKHRDGPGRGPRARARDVVSPAVDRGGAHQARVGRAFAVTHSAIHEELGKPHPAVFLTTARLLGVEPPECVRHRGLGGRRPFGQGRRHAGDRCAADHLFDEAGYDGADIKLRSLEELTPDMLR